MPTEVDSVDSVDSHSRTRQRPAATPPGPRFSQRWHWASKGAISFLMQQAVENPEVISLAAGLVDPATLPVEETQRAVEKLLAEERTARTALQYGTSAGAERLRRRLVEHLARLEGTTPDELGLAPYDLILTTGSQQLLSITAEILLDPGDICLVAAPTYFVFLGVLDGVGARAVPVATDSDGMRPDALEETLSRLEAAGELDRVKLIYLVSYYENPSGVSLAAERRGPIVEIVRRFSKGHKLYVLEDAAYRELRYDGPVLPSVWSCDPHREHVILTQTFSKSFSPGLRVGYGVVPRELLGPLCDRKGNEDFGSANFNQHLLATVFEEGLYEPHVEQVRAAYRAKRDAMLAAAERGFADLPGVSWFRPHGGLYVWMSLPGHIDTGFEGGLFHRAVKTEGVMYVPGELCHAPEFSLSTTGRSPSGSGVGRRQKNHMRLSFGVQDPAGIAEGMRRLAQAVRAVL